MLNPTTVQLVNYYVKDDPEVRARIVEVIESTGASLWHAAYLVERENLHLLASCTLCGGSLPRGIKDAHALCTARARRGVALHRMDYTPVCPCHQCTAPPAPWWVNDDVPAPWWVGQAACSQCACVTMARMARCPCIACAHTVAGAK